MTFFDQNTIRDITSNMIADIFAGIVLTILSFLLIDQTKLRPWIYEHVTPWVRDIYLFLNKTISSIYIKIGIYLFSLYMVYQDMEKNMFLLINIAITISFLIKGKYKNLKRLSTEFNDQFYKEEDILDNWKKVTGQPRLDMYKGSPNAPSLLLEKYDSQATHTFLIIKEHKSLKGVIELDAFFSPESLLNIVFLGDIKKHNWHMARFDTRESTTDGFLIKDGGPGANWRFNQMSGTKTSPGSWHKLRVEFSGERARMFRNGELIAEVFNPPIYGDQIGFFNECNEVNVDNFTLSIK